MPVIFVFLAYDIGAAQTENTAPKPNDLIAFADVVCSLSIYIHLHFFLFFYSPGTKTVVFSESIEFHRFLKLLW